MPRYLAIVDFAEIATERIVLVKERLIFVGLAIVVASLYLMAFRAIVGIPCFG